MIGHPVTVPKELEPVPKEPELSSENGDQENAAHALLVEPSSNTSKFAHLESQASRVALPATSLEEEQAILQDVAANLGSNDDFSDTGVHANCNHQPQKGTDFKRCAHSIY